MVLYIDSTQVEKVEISLKNTRGKIIDTMTSTQKKGSQVLLPQIAKLLKKHHLNVKDLTGVEVNVGPGSFTGTRVGVAIANALSFALHVPLNGKLGKIAEPLYTKSKFD
jgi:tRNA threonylcarbamoyladenosine biosynthesis protein TsaB